MLEFMMSIMKRLIIIIVYSSAVNSSFGQTITQKLQKAWQQFENDEQVKHAISSLYVIDAATGKVVFDRNSTIGLAPASTQKIITAATAFELLGKDYRYKTEFYVSDKNGKPDLIIVPSGDPTFGSGRWNRTMDSKVLSRILASIKNEIKSISWPIYYYAKGWSSNSIPDGWVWQDIGNYYGAGAEILNWRENQYDIHLQSGNNIGDPVKIISSGSEFKNFKISSQVISAAKGSGDNAYAYYPLGADNVIIRGTIPVNEKDFTISASYPSGKNAFELTFIDSLQHIYEKPGYVSSIVLYDEYNAKGKLIHTEVSPSLDSIIYWFLKKSINLYGEALVKTIAYEKKGYGATDTGVNIVKDFWRQKGIDPLELNLYDGSGLSPFNRVTTHAQVEVLKYAKKQSWFSHFYNALPEFNGMKMKSGTISDVKGFCGYQKAKDGKEYIFSFVVNNYNGISLSLVNKMYRVLDILK
jgi:serine-type D-Ala-D-Ala carboxypeptidase/endopeptidase (penicillin-binding protein 4)